MGCQNLDNLMGYEKLNNLNGLLEPEPLHKLSEPKQPYSLPESEQQHVITKGNHLSLYKGKPLLNLHGTLLPTRLNLHFKSLYFTNSFIWLLVN